MALNRRIQISLKRPYFAELPYYLWGTVNYDSDGDCKWPTDREWTWNEIKNRATGERVSITRGNGGWEIAGDEVITARVMCLLSDRCHADVDPDANQVAGDWNHNAAMTRTRSLIAEFEQPSLKPFDSHLWWGSWKWVGGFATEFTFVGRCIMHSVVRKDPRGIPFCIDWLKSPPAFPEQATTLCYALERLSGESSRSVRAWIRWYDGGFFSEGANVRYPAPDINTWVNDMNREFTTAE
ncbi:MAG: hypothetical protein AB7O26_08055 [Planctomycetaceae bacterium]